MCARTDESPLDRDQLLGLLDSVTDATLSVGRDWRVQYANRSAMDQLADAGELLGRRLWEIAPAMRGSDFEHTYVDAMDSGQPGHIEGFAPAYDAWFEADVYPGPEGLTIFFRERTEHRRQELVGELLDQVATAAEAGEGTIQGLANAAAQMRAFTGYELSKVWLRDHAGTTRLVSCEHDDNPHLADFAEAVHTRGLVPDGLAARAMEHGGPLVVDDLRGTFDAARAEAARAARLRAGVYLPLRWPDGVTAVIGMLTTAGPGHDDWCAVLTAAHPQLAALALRMRHRQEATRLFELAREGLCITGVDGWFHRVNPELERLLGRDAEELLSRPYLDFVEPEDRMILGRAVERLLAGGRPARFEHRVVLPSGEERILSWTSQAVPDEGLIYSATRDVTAERRRERFEADQRTLLRAIALGAPLEETLEQLATDVEAWIPHVRASVWLADHEHGLLHVAAAPSTPREYLDEIGALPIDPLHSVSGAAASTGLTTIVADVATDPRTTAYRDATAAHGIVACWAIPFHGPEGQVLGTISVLPRRRRSPSREELHIIEDAAQLAGVAVSRHLAQAALALSEERFRLLAGVTTDAMWDWDLVEDELWFNEGFATRFGFPPEEVASGLELWIANIHREDRAEVLASIERAVASAERLWEQEYRFHRGDGSEALVLARGSVVRDARGRAVRMVGGMWDLTAQRERDEARERARRLESLGTLAGGMAHDLGNVLAPILLTAELLGMRDLDDETLRLVERIERSSRRGSEMIRQVLAFARGTESELAPVDLAGVVDEVLGVARELLPGTVTLVTRLDDGLPTVQGDATQLHQVLLNLVVNARDAMPEGGTLTVSATPLGADGDAATNDGHERVRLRVSDTGEGMSEEVRRRALDPFFTTKGSGKGTGLGLATTLAIVESHEGALAIASEPGEGTTVTIDLPVGDEAMSLNSS